MGVQLKIGPKETKPAPQNWTQNWTLFETWAPVCRFLQGRYEGPSLVPISSYGKKLEASKASPYMIFRLVTTDDLLNIERAREGGDINRGVRITHYVD
jgi:hypothetical protein